MKFSSGCEYLSRNFISHHQFGGDQIAHFVFVMLYSVDIDVSFHTNDSSLKFFRKFKICVTLILGLHLFSIYCLILMIDGGGRINILSYLSGCQPKISELGLFLRGSQEIRLLFFSKSSELMKNPRILLFLCVFKVKILILQIYV